MLRYFDGFDYYASGDLAARYNITNGDQVINATGGRFNNGCLYSGGGGGAKKTSKFFDDQGAWVVGFAYKTAYSGYATILCSIEHVSGYQVELRLNSNNHLQLTANGTVLATGSTVLLPNTWYYLEFKATIATSCAANSCVARIGGVVECTAPASSNTNPQGTGTASRVSLHYDNFHAPGSYDDFYVLDGTGGFNTDFLGDMRVETLLPNAQGIYSDFQVSGAASNYQAVNEHTPDGDSSYVFASAVGKSESYRFPNLVSDPTSIAGLQLITIARKDDAGSHAIKGILRVAGTDYLGPEMGIQDTYVYLATIYEQNPHTSTPWTGTDVNSVEAGFTITR